MRKNHSRGEESIAEVFGGFLEAAESIQKQRAEFVEKYVKENEK